ncbi:hypothetical protein N1851_014026 [Merluccius polli]|uniref:Myb/SANT-like DNA-binding domain-containing protein n=1 Tax=Merluccius polli TaxID=89951 RepID=A0AA47MUQ5_MERPO|nr:hypothetical protein N1851_014026 [Merluccius polli]
MAGTADKKRRAFNFSQDELEALVQAVEDRKNVLFGKFSMTVTSQSKDRNWKEVADSVSAVCGMLRTVESTKKKWSSLASDAKIRGVLQRRDQAKTGAGLPEVKPLTSLEEKILAVMGQVYTEGIATGTEVGQDELCEQKSGEVYQSTLSDPESRRVILTLMDSECDIMNLPPAIVIPSPAKKKKHIGLQEELLGLEKEKLLDVSWLPIVPSPRGAGNAGVYAGQSTTNVSPARALLAVCIPRSRAHHHLHLSSLQSWAVGSRCWLNLGQPTAPAQRAPCQPAPQSAPNVDPADEIEERLEPTGFHAPVQGSLRSHDLTSLRANLELVLI